MKSPSIITGIVLLFALGSVSAIELELADEFSWADLETEDSLREPRLGASVVTDGQWAVAGAPGADNFTGRLYLFRAGPAGSTPWVFVKQLEIPANSAGCDIGGRMDMDGDVLSVGGISSDSTCGAYIYQRDAGGVDNWGFVRLIAEPVGTGRDIRGFGVDLAVSGNLLAIGSPFTRITDGDGTRTNVGEVYIHQRDAGGNNGWGEVARLILPPPEQVGSPQFGLRLALEADRLVVGSPNQSRAWIYEQNLGGAGNWGRQQTLIGTLSDGLFGSDVDLSGDTVAIGASFGSGSNDGAAFLFDRNEGGSNNWGLVDTVIPDVADFGDFGGSVDIEGGLLAVGEGFNSFSPGGVWLFQRQAGNQWVREQSLLDDGLGSDERAFGNAVALAQTGTRTVLVVGDEFSVLPQSPFDGGRFGKVYFYEYDDGLFSDGFE